MTTELRNAREVREHMADVGTTQTAFVDGEGTHVLVHRDRDGHYGLVDPSSFIQFRFLHRCTGIWPLKPLETAS